MGKKRGFEATGANAVPSQKKRKSSDVVIRPSPEIIVQTRLTGIGKSP